MHSTRSAAPILKSFLASLSAHSQRSAVTPALGFCRRWLLACRPKTLWAGVCPVIAGTVIAVGDGALVDEGAEELVRSFIGELDFRMLDAELFSQSNGMILTGVIY